MKEVRDLRKGCVCVCVCVCVHTRASLKRALMVYNLFVLIKRGFSSECTRGL